MEENIWKERVGKDINAKGLGSCNRNKRRVYAKKREGILIVKRRERGSTSIHGGSAEKRVYLSF